MKNSFGTTARDASASRREAFKEGERDGGKQYPAITPDGSTANDYASDAHHAEAKATAELHTAAHLDQQRPVDDAALGSARADTAVNTTHAYDARLTNEEDKAELRAAKQRLPLSARFTVPKRLVGPILFVLALGSAAATTAALLGATEDPQWLTVIIGAAVAVGTIIAAWGFGTLLRRRDLDTIKSGEYSSTGVYSTFVLLLVGLGGLAFAFGVAGIRQAASEQDAYRRAKQNTVQILIPGTTARSTTGTSSPVKQPNPPKGVTFWTWFLFEFGLFAVATGVEFLRADARGEHLVELEGREKRSHEEWKVALDELGVAVGGHETALAVRTDHDASVSLAANSQIVFADVLKSGYRHGSLYARGQVGDPFATTTPSPRLRISGEFDEKPGTDVLALPHGDKVQKKEYLDGLIASVRDLELLDKAYAELGRAPQRPERNADEPYTPGEYLELDPSAKALADSRSNTHTPGALSEVVTDNEVDDDQEDELIDATVPDFVPELVGNNGNGSES